MHPSFALTLYWRVSGAGDAERCAHTLEGFALRLRVEGVFQAGPRDLETFSELRKGGRNIVFSRAFRIFGCSALMLSATAAAWFPQAALAVSKVKVTARPRSKSPTSPALTSTARRSSGWRAGARWRSNRVARYRSSPAPRWGWRAGARWRLSLQPGTTVGLEKTGGESLYADLATTVDGMGALHSFFPGSNFQDGGVADKRFILSVSTRLYADPGSVVTLTVRRTVVGTARVPSFPCSLSGYYVDAT